MSRARSTGSDSRTKLGEEQASLLLDSNLRAEGHEFYALGALEVSRNNRWLAVAEDFLSRRQYQIQFLDLESGQWATDKLENTSGNLVWANDNKTVFYVRKHPQTLLPYQVYRHTLGTDPATDKLVYEEKDDSFYISLYATTSEDFIVIALSSTTTGEARLIDANQPEHAPACSCPVRWITNTAWITTAAASMCAPTRTARTSASMKPKRARSIAGRW